MKRLPIIILMACLLSSCAKKSDQQLFKEGQAAEGQKDFTSALKNYQEIVERFPQAALAESSQLRIAVLYNNDVRDIPKSIDAYRKFYAMYPNSAQAPTAMFLIGFLFNNEMHRIDSAKVAYEAFIQKYPGHDLASSARFELENLGKDPTQLFQQEQASKDDVKATKPREAGHKAKKPAPSPQQPPKTVKSSKAVDQ